MRIMNQRVEHKRYGIDYICAEGEEGLRGIRQVIRGHGISISQGV